MHTWARMDGSEKTDKTEYRDGAHRAVYKTVPHVRAVAWSRDGADKERGAKYAKDNGYVQHELPDTHDVLAKARARHVNMGSPLAKDESVDLDEAKAKLGSGKRFAALKGELSHEKGVSDPAAVAAAIGRKKYGAKKMGAMSHHESVEPVAEALGHEKSWSDPAVHKPGARVARSDPHHNPAMKPYERGTVMRVQHADKAEDVKYHVKQDAGGSQWWNHSNTLKEEAPAPVADMAEGVKDAEAHIGARVQAFPAGHKAALTDLWHGATRGTHFKHIMRAAENLHKKGVIHFDGVHVSKPAAKESAPAVIEDEGVNADYAAAGRQHGPSHVLDALHSHTSGASSRHIVAASNAYHAVLGHGSGVINHGARQAVHAMVAKHGLHKVLGAAVHHWSDNKHPAAGKVYNHLKAAHAANEAVDESGRPTGFGFEKDVAHSKAQELSAKHDTVYHVLHTPSHSTQAHPRHAYGYAPESDATHRHSGTTRIATYRRGVKEAVELPAKQDPAVKAASGVGVPAAEPGRPAVVVDPKQKAKADADRSNVVSTKDTSANGVQNPAADAPPPVGMNKALEGFLGAVMGAAGLGEPVVEDEDAGVEPDAVVEAEAAGEADHNHPMYHTPVKVKGMRAKQTAASNHTGNAGSILRKVAPHLSKAGHLHLAKGHAAKAKEHDKSWGETQHAAHMHTFKTKPAFHDYKVSGVGRDEYSDEHKEKLRHHAHAASLHRALSHAHLSAGRHAPSALGEDVYADGHPVTWPAPAEELSFADRVLAASDVAEARIDPNNMHHLAGQYQVHKNHYHFNKDRGNAAEAEHHRKKANEFAAKYHHQFANGRASIVTPVMNHHSIKQIGEDAAMPVPLDAKTIAFKPVGGPATTNTGGKTTSVVRLVSEMGSASVTLATLLAQYGGTPAAGGGMAIPDRAGPGVPEQVQQQRGKGLHRHPGRQRWPQRGGRGPEHRGRHGRGAQPRRQPEGARGAEHRGQREAAEEARRAPRERRPRGGQRLREDRRRPGPAAVARAHERHGQPRARHEGGGACRRVVVPRSGRRARPCRGGSQGHDAQHARLPAHGEWPDPGSM